MEGVRFDEREVIRKLKHYLPAQAPLKDFIHHNTLHAFQHQEFHPALQEAAEIFGYKTYLSLDEYRRLYREKKISEEVLKRTIVHVKGEDHVIEWREKLLNAELNEEIAARIGAVRNEWKNLYKVSLSKFSHPILFRIIGNYIDQGIAIQSFPVTGKSFLESVRELERNSPIGLLKNPRPKSLLFQAGCDLKKLLQMLVGDEALFEQYLFDQQFEHPGWSGMVSVLEDNPNALYDKREITLGEFIFFELLLEIDALDSKFGENWLPLGVRLTNKPAHLFEEVRTSDLFAALSIWHEAFEWTYYDAILTGLQHVPKENSRTTQETSFQSVFCIDDRECSLRRYLEDIDRLCRTFATAGFFNVEFYFQPEGGKVYTKLCPAPVTPKHIIKEVNKKNKRSRDIHFSKRSYGLLGGWITSQTLGFWSALKLLGNIFRPSLSSAMSYSFNHMDKEASLTIENKDPNEMVDQLQVGFTIEEMTDRIETLLRSIGLVSDFAPLVYFIGHGASSVNNTYYAGYDCGACSGRPGSVNARVAAHMANHEKVRTLLKERGLLIPAATQFIGGLQDTTRDEIEFYDEDLLTESNKIRHVANTKIFTDALSKNAKERARRFILQDNKQAATKVHKEVKLRSVSLFEPRPEYNHATNTLCIVGRRDVSGHLFLDRRSFLNSFDYRLDPDGKYLLNILKAVAPVCGGINLEYYFSRVDNQRLGAGSKLPHNVMGLVGVVNGADGDLRTGLPLQMIEIHDPLRLLVIVEHFPEVILRTIQQHLPTYEWFENNWIHLLAIHPESRVIYRFGNGAFSVYSPVKQQLRSLENLDEIVESERGNIEPIVRK